MSMSDEQSYYLAFSVFPGIGPVRFRALLTRFGTAKAAWEAPEAGRAGVIGGKLSAELTEFQRGFSVSSYENELKRQHISAIPCCHDRYPKFLREISDPPIVLYVKGKRGDGLIDLTRTVGVVGTRKISAYGTEMTARIAGGLAANGVTVVSGMAYGVDAVAHAAALDAGGATVAVLGCGVDIIAPPVNTRLYHRIIDSGRGAVVSEMPLGLRPSKGLFPARNRIISGLSLGVVVTEGADDSGALITARYAAEQGREVFAVPGPVTSPTSRGPSRLIKDGATLVESAEDVMNELNLSKSPPLPNMINPTTHLTHLSSREKQLVDILSAGPVHIDDLARSAGMAIQETSAALTVLEMDGVVKDTGGKIYVLCL